MDTVLILVRQILQMFLLAALGFVLFRTGRISQEGSKALANILIYLVIPVVIINGFMVERDEAHLIGMAVSAAASAVLLLVSTVIARLFFRRDAIAAFSAAFSNPGFFGIPLILASLGSGAVFYVNSFLALLNIGQWTYGVSIMTGQPVRQSFRPKQLIRAPFVCAIAIGLVLFLTQLQLPEIVQGCMNSVAALNTPLAMFTVGIYLAQTNVRNMLRRRSLPLLCAVRLLIIPAVSALLLSLLPASMNTLKFALLLVAACPAGSNVAVYAQLHGKDYPYAVETVITTTLCSLASIPLVVYLAELLGFVG